MKPEIMIEIDDCDFAKSIKGRTTSKDWKEHFNHVKECFDAQ